MTVLTIVLAIVVMNVEVQYLTLYSARVSWTNVEVPQQLHYSQNGYIVYYRQAGSQSEGSLTVQGSNNSAEIVGLDFRMEYQFQVAALFNFNGEIVPGVRSKIASRELGDPAQRKLRIIILGAFGGVIGVSIFIVMIIAFIYLRFRRYVRGVTTKSTLVRPMHRHVYLLMCSIR